MKMCQLNEREGQHVCIYGEPFTGKSTLASLLAESGYKMIWISLDNGHEVIRKLSPAAQERFEVIKLPDTKQFPIGMKTCLKIVAGGPVKVCFRHGEVDCIFCERENIHKDEWTYLELNKIGLDTIVVIDPISQLAESAMNIAILKAIKSKDKDASGEVEKDPDFFKPRYDEYRVQGFLMNKVLGEIQQAPWHCICITHVIETELEDGTKRLVPLIGTTNYSRNAPKFFDHLIYCRLSNQKHDFGSKTIYTKFAATGSRADVVIEDQKSVPSLDPFFSTRITNSKNTAQLSLTRSKELLGEGKGKVIDVETETEKEKEQE